MTAAMQDGRLGLIDTPLQGSRKAKESVHTAGGTWCADNGCFSDKWDEAKWWKFLVGNAHRADTCLFAVAPDVVEDATATLEASTPWLARIRDLGYPVAFVAQDGITQTQVPWDDIDALFIGGSDAFKLGPEGRWITAQAKARGKWVHMGRVNSERRYRYAHSIGCDSADGTFLIHGPDKNLPTLLAWARVEDQGQLFEVTA